MTNEQRERLEAIVQTKFDSRSNFELCRLSVEGLLAERDMLLALLVSMEWCDVYDCIGYCPLCGGDRGTGHTKDCKLAEVIALAKGETNV